MCKDGAAKPDVDQTQRKESPGGRRWERGRYRGEEKGVKKE